MRSFASDVRFALRGVLGIGTVTATTWVPDRRATRVDHMEALRHE